MNVTIKPGGPGGGYTTTTPSKFKFQDNISVLKNISLSGKRLRVNEHMQTL